MSQEDAKVLRESQWEQGLDKFKFAWYARLGNFYHIDSSDLDSKRLG